MCVLLLWLGSILIFIRHSELLRIRHRDLPFRSSAKLPMNLNHITVVHRTSDTVIHPKPRYSSARGLKTSVYCHKVDKHNTTETLSSSNVHLPRKKPHRYEVHSNNSLAKHSYHDEQLLNPCTMSSDVRRSLLDLHRKSVNNLSAVRCNMSYSTNDISQFNNNTERFMNESPI